ncbi:AraC family transcriptional regulator [Amycolatopsis sp. 195334CR]|uniref:helix-turn-helix domain-containing protein n=1 Tax=Amycolatopsis sp. 195334CR TaxID=2814588 RepID=UPI001A8C4D62|nr:helix-turn-helix transcriptional regulator [Amycolatopsis sp. 195334CR]MBN6038828.1 helix-turn-helix transcriptional regulator [Amycolatopsis sp. 195334CR]
MRSTTRLAGGPGFAIDDIRVRMDAPCWTRPEATPAYRLVFVRHGVYRLRLRRWELLADPATVYAAHAGDEQSIAHRAGAQDTATAITLSPELLADFVGDGKPAPAGPQFTDGRIDLAHRVLLARARRGADDFELADRVLHLAGEVLAPQRDSARPAAARGSGAGRRMAESVREILVHDPVSLSLDGLAAKVNVSPAYLSRVFSRETGLTLTRFRNRLRVRRVLDRIEEGETSLSSLAVELGFADHAHLSRTVREEIGCSPSAVRVAMGTAAR